MVYIEYQSVLPHRIQVGGGGNLARGGGGGGIQFRRRDINSGTLCTVQYTVIPVRANVISLCREL
jgi:hypothetical protein